MLDSQTLIPPSRRKHDVMNGSGEFDLLRYFSLVCLTVFVVITVVMCTGFYHISKYYIQYDAEQRSAQVAERLAPLVFVNGGSLPIPESSDYAVLANQLRDVLEPLGIFKVNIYNAEGKIVYSSVHRDPTEAQNPNHEQLRRALAGGVVSDLQDDTVVWDHKTGRKTTGVIVDTWVPILGADPAHRVQGVLELSQDVTPTYARLPGVVAMIVGASVLAMGTLYGILYLFVRKADQIIREQTRTIRHGKAEIEKHALELEERVEERTRQLRATLAQQRHDEKMVAMGTLAAGVAHELNTPLGSILGSTQLVLDHCSSINASQEENQASSMFEGCRQCVEDLERIESEAKRCRSIIRNLVDFARKPHGERSWESLHELVERSVSMMSLEAKQCGVRVETALDDDLPPVLVSGNEIQQVLVNIMNNGIAAMPNGGTLGIRLSRRKRTARIEIRDTGTGIDEADLPRIFEPFFTTKEVGKGTGLGLSISYRIIKDHGGNITVESAADEGSTFCIELPMEVSRLGVDEENNRAAALREDAHGIGET